MQGMQQATPQPARTRNPFDDDGPPAPVCAKCQAPFCLSILKKF